MRVTGAFKYTNLTVPIHKPLFVINKKPSDIMYGLLIHQSHDAESANCSSAELKQSVALYWQAVVKVICSFYYFTPWLKIKTVYMI